MNISNRNNKKGQLAIYLIVGLIIVLLAITSIVFFITNINTNVGLSISNNPLAFQIDYCVRKYIEPSINLLANNGGYIYGYNQIMKTENMQVAYHIKNWTDQSAPLEFMERELRQVVEDTILECLYELRQEIQEEITIGEPLADVKISRNNVAVTLNMDVAVKYQDQTEIFSDYIINIDSKLSELIN
ncbi:MAG: hypothetical protein ACMXYG_03190 [Candidatus Woesearchaeota archaeon]